MNLANEVSTAGMPYTARTGLLVVECSTLFGGRDRLTPPTEMWVRSHRTGDALWFSRRRVVYTDDGDEVVAWVYTCRMLPGVELHVLND